MGRESSSFKPPPRWLGRSAFASTPADGKTDAAAPALSVSGLSKRFGGTEALQNVDLVVQRGEIHALLGANGAGKSTLIKILAGVHQPDAGHIRIGGLPLGEGASRSRISFVHQDLGLIESMSVGENMALAYGYPTRWGLIDWNRIDAAAMAALEFMDAPLPLDRPVSQFSQAEKSIIAIARALTDQVDLLVLDEPTASLPEADVTRLFDILRRLKAQNVAIVYVSHRLDEVLRLADAVTVLRDGRSVVSYRPVTRSSAELVTDIVGHAPEARRSRPLLRKAEPMLAVRDLSVEIKGRNLGPVSFEVGRGEVVGLAGLRGQGQEVIGRAIAGALPCASGEITVAGHIVDLRSVRVAIDAGIGFVSSKRGEEELSAGLNVRENLFLNPRNFGRRNLSPASPRKETAHAQRLLAKFDVRPADPSRDISSLSGGNQQKVILARWAGQSFRLLVLEEPTMGVDVGAKTEIYRILAQDAALGTACLVTSSDLEELVEICDRVLAFGGGRIVAELRRDELSIAALTQAVSDLAKHTPELGGALSVDSLRPQQPGGAG